MQRLFDEFGITKKSLQSKSHTALETDFHQKRCSSVQSDCISPLAYCRFSLSRNQKLNLKPFHYKNYEFDI